MASEPERETLKAGAGPAAAPSGAREAPEPEEPLEHLTYEGTCVPKLLVLLWTVFFVWGVAYLLRFVPESVREWFLGK
jgi:hypothetical protein